MMFTKKLKACGVTETAIGSIFDYMNRVRIAIMLSPRLKLNSEDIQHISFVVVVRNSGEPVVFTLCKESIIDDMLDTSYAVSRELLGLSRWNFHKAFMVTLGEESFLEKQIPYCTLLSLIHNVMKPTLIEYMVVNKNSGSYTDLLIDTTLVSGLGYTDYVSCIEDTYNRKSGEHATLSDLLFHIVFCEAFKREEG